MDKIANFDFYKKQNKNINIYLCVYVGNGKLRTIFLFVHETRNKIVKYQNNVIVIVSTFLMGQLKLMRNLDVFFSFLLNNLQIKKLMIIVFM